MDASRAEEILDFWQSAGPEAWFRKDAKFDGEIESRFADLYQMAITQKLDNWRDQPQSCLALILMLDQFSRNMFRNSDEAFAQDSYALELAKYAIENGYDHSGREELAMFFYLPLMHSENLADQKTCLALFRKDGNEGSIKAAIEHRDIIKQFGRFPHRNKVLGRETSDAEQAFLDGGGFSG